MLSNAGMGGMEEMSVFYDHCLESLYPPGMCVSGASWLQGRSVDSADS